MLNTIKKLLFLIIFFYFPYQSQAWGVLGHRIVGHIAESQLTPKAKKEIEKILGTETLAMSSNWMDFIKSDTTYNYLGNWHYINFKPWLSTEDFNAFLKEDSSTNAYTKIFFLVKELKNKKLLKDTQLMYLRILVHLVGDIHQPMHTARPEDRGGNSIKVMWFNTPTNLHALWDESLVNFQQLSYTEYSKVINYSTKMQRATWTKQPLSEWLYESYRISEQLYAEIKQPDQKLSYNYNFQHIATVNEQLLKGGVRLGGLLNEIFGM
ncbi:MAG: Nuclease [Segetibacter sp.]|nr:Nuclease [Segetibacter sp.]